MLYIFLALLLYSATIMFATLASRGANAILVSAILNSISAIIPIALVAPLLNKQLFVNSRQGIIMAVFAGIAVAFFSIFLTKSYAVNKIAIVAPIVFGGAIFLTAILSAIFFKEKITLMQGIGLLLLGIGLIVVIIARISGK